MRRARRATGRVGAAWLAAAALALGAAGCGEQQAPEGRNAVNVMLLAPTSGDLSSYGGECRLGAEVARALIALARRDAKPPEPRLWLEIRDDRADTRAALRTARQLYPVARFVAILGPLTAETVAVTAAEMAPHGVTLVVPAVETETLRAGRPNVVQACLRSSQIGQRLAAFVRRDLRADTAGAVVVRAADDPEGKALADGFAAALGQAARVATLEVRSETEDVKRLPALVKAERPGAVVAALGPDGLAALLVALRAAGETVPVIGGTHAYSRPVLDVGSSNLRDVYVAAHFAPDEKRPEVEAFVRAYREAPRGGALAESAGGEADPGAIAALAADALHLIDEAVRRATPPGTFEGDRAAFPSPEAVAGVFRAGFTLARAVTGPITVHPDGSVSKPLFVLRLSDVGPVFCARVDP